MNSERNNLFTSKRITRVKSTNLDRLIQILEISFIFLLSFSLITLVDAAFVELNLYQPISNAYLGEPNVGALYGGHFETVVRVTLIFNLLLFLFSLTFGLWIRRTRDGWTWQQLGYTFKTDKYETASIARRAILLGFISVAIWFTLTSFAAFLQSGDLTSIFTVHAFTRSDGGLFTASQLPAEYYFGFVEMGLIWPASAGFFFFAYAHNSLKARFPIGVANILSSMFYVFYLLFFFMIEQSGKLRVIPSVLTNPGAIAALISFLIILYIAFSAFAETESVLLPFLFTFILNGVLTVIKSFNALFYQEHNVLMIVPYVLLICIIGVWYFVKKEDFSTIRLGLKHLKMFTEEDEFKKYKLKFSSILVGLVTLFIVLSFLVPGILEQLVADYHAALESGQVFQTELLGYGYAFIYVFIIGIAVLVLTYEPTQIYDTLLVKHPDGIPLSSKIKLFKSDDVLISGFFTAISGVSDELGDSDRTEIRSIKRGEREILIEDGVYTRLIALADRDQRRIRQDMTLMLRDFEKENAQAVQDWMGEERSDLAHEAEQLVNKISQLSIKFDLPQQTRWLTVLTLILTPLMIGLLALI